MPSDDLIYFLNSDWQGLFKYHKMINFFLIVIDKAFENTMRWFNLIFFKSDSKYNILDNIVSGIHKKPEHFHLYVLEKAVTKFKIYIIQKRFKFS